MSTWYWQALSVYTSNEDITIKHLLKQGQLCGFIYNTATQRDVNIDKAFEHIQLADEDGSHHIYVEFQDTTFTLRFSYHRANSSLYISLAPPNSTWTLLPNAYFIDNARYVKLLFCLSKDLLINDVIVYSEGEDLPKAYTPNTIIMYVPESTIEKFVNNIYRYNYSADINLQDFAHLKLDPTSTITFSLQAYSYNMNVCVTQDIFYLTALEPYAIKVVQDQAYIDVAFYVNIGLTIYDTLPLREMNTNFNLSII